MAAAHKVKSEETLWSISKHHLGAGHLWPAIYIHNNSPEIVRQRGERLMVGAAFVVGVMIVQDLATAGVGIADNGAAIGLAAAMWTAGRAANSERQRIRPGA